MADSAILLDDGISKLLLSNGEYLNLADAYDEPDVNMIFGGLQNKIIRKQAIPISIRVKIHSKLYVKNAIKLTILSKLYKLSIRKIPIISTLITTISPKLKLESKLQVKQKENFNVTGKQSYAEFYRTIISLEEMV